MKKFCLWLIFLLPFVSGCGASKPIPDWLNASHNKLESYKSSYLTGRDKFAASQFKDLLTEVKKSGDLHVLGIIYLNRMALQTACLEEPGSDEFLKIAAAHPDRENDNFYAFLKGETQKVEESLLPRQYREIYRDMRLGAEGDYARAMEKIKDPLPQLVAAGIIVRLGKDNEAVLIRAVATASEQGWKKAVLVYLERLKSYYEGRQETQKALAVGERINLVRD